jgi:hypothetical protein
MAEASDKPDLTSVLNHVSALETEKRALQEHLTKQGERLERLTQAKRDEMKTQLDTMIVGWLKDIDVNNEEVKTEFMTGMERLVKDTKDDSGVWQVMCCASNAHRRNVMQLQKIQDEYNELKTKVEGGTFRTEDARLGKRKRPEDEEEVVRGPGNIWDEFEGYMKGGGLSSFIPEPGVVKELRKEWTPVVM